MINSPGTVSGKVSFCIVCIAFSAFRARYHLEQKQENNGEDKDNVQDTLVFGTGAVEKKKIIVRRKKNYCEKKKIIVRRKKLL